MSEVTTQTQGPQGVLKEPYMADYDKFMETYKRGEVSGEEVGELISRMAQYFAYYNMRMVADDRRRAATAKDIESRADENGKAISSSKAAVFLDATDEAHAHRVSRMHLQNVEMFINSLKSLQKGVLNEYVHSGL